MEPEPPQGAFDSDSYELKFLGLQHQQLQLHGNGWWEDCSDRGILNKNCVHNRHGSSLHLSTVEVEELYIQTIGVHSV